MTTQKEICYSFYRNGGWGITKNKKIKGCDLSFDILKRNKEKKLLYFFDNKEDLKEFIKIIKALKILAPEFDITLSVPSNSNFKTRPLDSKKIAEEGGEIISIENGIVNILISPSMIKKQEHEIVVKIKKELSDINVVSLANQKIDFGFFDINDRIIRLIKPRLANDSEYVTQISAISLILDMINQKEIIKKFNPPKQEIEKGKINLLYWSLKKLGGNPNIQIFDFFRDLRKLRADEPIHLKKKNELKRIEHIKKSLTGIANPSKKVIWGNILQKFLTNLSSIKKEIKSIK